jgi:uncharacterized membrane protein YfbV (UPF0208 family)
LVLLLGVLVVVLIARSLLFAQNQVIGLLWPALIACLSLSALFGSKRIATVLKYLLYFMSASTILIVLSQPMSTGALAVSLAIATLTLSVALYLARSKAVAQFYASETQPPKRTEA